MDLTTRERTRVAVFPELTEPRLAKRRGSVVMLVRSALADGAHVRGLKALRTLVGLEFDLLSFFEIAVARTADRAEVHEDVGAPTVLGDEAEALLTVKPLHGTSCH